MPTLRCAATCTPKPLATTTLPTSSATSAPPYVLQIAPLSAHQALSWAYSTSDSSQINIIQAHPSASTFSHGPTLSTSNDGRGRVTELKSSASRPELLIAGFLDSSALALWDLRQANSHPTLELRGTTPSSFLSCDICAAGHILAGGSGTEHEARIELFDLRAPTVPLHAYTESHSDLVTTVAFHPTTDDRLVSGSADGLLATYDVRIEDEDQAVIGTGNVGASVARVRWSADGQSLWAGTDMETLSVWKAEDLELIQDFGDIRNGNLAKPHPSWTDTTAYLIDCTSLPLVGSLSRTCYFSGSQTGEIALIETSSGDSWGLLASLTGGHNDIVRSAIVDHRNGMLLTGGEDGRICLWPNVFEDDNQSEEAQRAGAQSTPSTLKQSRYKPY